MLRAAATAVAMLTLGGLNGCQSSVTSDSVTSDAGRYRDVVAAAAFDADKAVAGCAEISDPDLRGDCAVFVAQRLGPDDSVQVATVCEVADEGLWRDECWFVAAEKYRRSGQRGDAAAACRASGRFANDCGQHLWQSEVRATIAPNRRGATQPSFEEALPRATMIYTRWAPLLEEGTDMEQRFWRRFYQNGFERRGWIDLQRCTPLPDADLARCEDAGAKLMWARLDQDLRQMGIDPCTLTQGVAPVAPNLRVVASRALDEALQRWQGLRCGGGPTAPDPEREGLASPGAGIDEAPAPSPSPSPRIDP